MHIAKVTIKLSIFYYAFPPKTTILTSILTILNINIIHKMKHLFLSIATSLILASCGGPSAPSSSTSGKVANSEKSSELPAPTIKVYVENSGSMDGYVKGATDFENAVYSYLSDIQLAKLGVQRDSAASLKNIMELNYINSQVLKQPSDVQAFIKALEPYTFKQKGGNRGTSDMADILAKIIKQTADNDISIFISDCIFSPGKQYKQKDNADEYLVSQQIAIKSHFVEKINQNTNFAVIVMRLLSQFNGLYYNKFDNKTSINGNRPFYIWLMGDIRQLKRVMNAVHVSEIKGSGVQHMYMSSLSNKPLSYGILPGQGIGKFNPDKDNPKTTITNAKTDNKGGENRFQIAIGVDYSAMLLPNEYLTNPDNYKISNKAYTIEISQNSNPKSRYTHIIKLNLIQPVISKGSITISLMNLMPSWINDYTDETGLNINADGAMEKTYGLKYLIGGIYDAYKDQNYGSITINIK